MTLKPQAHLDLRMASPWKGQRWKQHLSSWQKFQNERTWGSLVLPRRRDEEECPEPRLGGWQTRQTLLDPREMEIGTVPLFCYVWLHSEYQNWMLLFSRTTICSFHLYCKTGNPAFIVDLEPRTNITAHTCKPVRMMKSHCPTRAMGSKVRTPTIQGTPTVTAIVTAPLICFCWEKFRFHVSLGLSLYGTKIGIKPWRVHYSFQTLESNNQGNLLPDRYRWNHS